MYGGVGGEVLYSPYMQRWALGLNVNAVKQRGFERDFDFRRYKTVTAFASAYYASPFYDIDMAVHVGRYLAQDVGYTFEARRTFDSGFSIGGFFTRTNVSAEEFGEGSFDKGLFSEFRLTVCSQAILAPLTARFCGRWNVMVVADWRISGEAFGLIDVRYATML